MDIIYRMRMGIKDKLGYCPYTSLFVFDKKYKNRHLRCRYHLGEEI